MPPTSTLALLSALAACGTSRSAAAGVRDGRLAPCPNTPNCVSTTSDDPARRLAPLRFTGSSTDALDRLERVARSMPRARIVVREGRYMHAEFASRVFRFVDDVEFLVDEQRREIHFRSASRLGRGDFGVNRRRMREITERFARA